MRALEGTFELPTKPQTTDSMNNYLFFASADRRDYAESACFEV